MKYSLALSFEVLPIQLGEDASRRSLLVNYLYEIGSVEYVLRLYINGVEHGVSLIVNESIFGVLGTLSIRDVVKELCTRWRLSHEKSIAVNP